MTGPSPQPPRQPPRRPRPDPSGPPFGGRTPAPWYLMPSANPGNAARCTRAWRERGYRVAILEDRVPVADAARDAGADAIVRAATYPGWAASIHRLFREVVPGDVPVIVAGGDDLFPDDTHDADAIAASFLERFPDTLGVMQPVGDDFEATATICGSPWIGRAWMERMYGGTGGLCEAYHQQFADEELFWVARCADRLWLRSDLAQRHEHFRRLGRPAPAYWVASAAAHEERDCLTFVARSRAGFPGAAPADGSVTLERSVFDRGYDGRADARLRELLGADRGGPADTGGASRRLGAAFDRLATEGAHRVLVYGAGQHTRRCADALARPAVEVAALVDDDPERVGTRLWNYPVVDRDDALALVQRGAIDAVVLSSDAMEARLDRAARPLAVAGARIVRLYGEDARAAATDRRATPVAPDPIARIARSARTRTVRSLPKETAMWVFACGMFRSGSTLQFQLVSEMVEAAGLGRRMPWADPEDFGTLAAAHEKAHGDDALLVFKTHVCKHPMRERLAAGRALAVGTHRDLRDVAVSGARKAGVEPTADYCRDLAEGCMACAEGWHRDHVAAARILELAYDDLVRRPAACCLRMATHLHVPLTPEQADDLARRFAPDRQRARIDEAVREGAMQPPRPGGRLRHMPRELLHPDHIDDGATGKWRGVLDDDALRAIESVAGGWLLERGYVLATDAWTDADAAPSITLRSGAA